MVSGSSSPDLLDLATSPLKKHNSWPFGEEASLPQNPRMPAKSSVPSLESTNLADPSPSGTCDLLYVFAGIRQVKMFGSPGNIFVLYSKTATMIHFRK